MRVVVTGGAGFIGGNLCRILGADGAIDEVIAFDDLSSGSATNLVGTGARLVAGSILNADLLARTCAGADAIVHLAALGSIPRSIADPVPSHQVNASGTVNVLEAARACGAQVVFASSSSVYGSNPTLPKHELLATSPLSPYAASKLAAEAYTLSWGAAYGLPVLAFRFFNVYGPLQSAEHQYAAVVPRFVSAALAGQPLIIYGDGTQTRDFTYVDSVASVLTSAVVARVTSSEPINLAFGTRCSLLELIAIIETELGRQLPVEHHAARVGDVAHSQAAHERLDALFPTAHAVPLAVGLRNTVRWMSAITR